MFTIAGMALLIFSKLKTAKYNCYREGKKKMICNEYPIRVESIDRANNLSDFPFEEIGIEERPIIIICRAVVIVCF